MDAFLKILFIKAYFRPNLLSVCEFELRRTKDQKWNVAEAVKNLQCRTEW